MTIACGSLFTGMIDKMIQDSDNDKDGFVNYQEYKRVRRPDGVWNAGPVRDRRVILRANGRCRQLPHPRAARIWMNPNTKINIS